MVCLWSPITLFSILTSHLPIEFHPLSIPNTFYHLTVPIFSRLRDFKLIFLLVRTLNPFIMNLRWYVSPHKDLHIWLIMCCISGHRHHLYVCPHKWCPVIWADNNLCHQKPFLHKLHLSLKILIIIFDTYP
jgi:hypothetical protein